MKIWKKNRVKKIIIQQKEYRENNIYKDDENNDFSIRIGKRRPQHNTRRLTRRDWPILRAEKKKQFLKK